MPSTAGATTPPDLAGTEPPEVAGAGGPGRERQPIPATAYLERGLLVLERPRPEDQAEAQRLLRKALAAEPGLAAAHAGLARSSLYLYTLGIDEDAARLREALEEAHRAVDAAPDSTAAGAVLALAEAAADHLTPARAAALRAVEQHPDEPDGHLALCIVERLRRDLPAALASCRHAADRAPGSPRILVALGEALRESGDFRTAMEMFGQAADLDAESALAQLGGAATLTRMGKIPVASRAYDLVLEKFPFATTRALQGAAAMRIAASDWEGALELYERVKLPDNGSLPTLLSLYGKGYALLQLDRAAEAEYFLSLLAARVPPDYDGPARGREVLFRAYDDLARYFAGRGRDGRATAVLREAAARPGAPTRFGRLLAERLAAGGAAGEAATALERSLLGAPADEDALEMGETILALARLRSSAGRKAIPPRSETGLLLAAAADRITPDAPGAAHYRVARAFALARDPDRCLAALGRARAGGYLPEQAATEADFDSVRARPEFRALLEPPAAQP